MPDEKKSWMRRRVEGAIRGGLTRTYDTIKVDPGPVSYTHLPIAF